MLHYEETYPGGESWDEENDPANWPPPSDDPFEIPAITPGTVTNQTDEEFLLEILQTCSCRYGHFVAENTDANFEILRDHLALDIYGNVVPSNTENATITHYFEKSATLAHAVRCIKRQREWAHMILEQEMWYVTSKCLVKLQRNGPDDEELQYP